MINQGSLFLRQIELNQTGGWKRNKSKTPKQVDQKCSLLRYTVKSTCFRTDKCDGQPEALRRLPEGNMLNSLNTSCDGS